MKNFNNSAIKKEERKIRDYIETVWWQKNDYEFQYAIPLDEIFYNIRPICLY